MNKDILFAASIAIIALLAYSQFFGIQIPEFDAVANTLSHSSQNPAETIKIFTSPQQSYHLSSIVYRPVESLVWRLFFSFQGMNLTLSHLFMFLLHALNSALVFVLATKLLRDKSRIFSFTAALAFALNPIHLHTVLFASRLPELLVAFSLFSSLLLLSKYFKSKNKIFFHLAIFTCFAGVFSKAAGSLIPPVLLLCVFIFSKEPALKKRVKNAFKLCFPFLVLIPVYIALMFFSLGKVAGYTSPSQIPLSKLVVNFINYAFLPANFIQTTFFQDVLTLTANSTLGAFTVIVFLAFALIALKFFSQKRERKQELFLFTWLMLFVLAFLASNRFYWWYMYVPTIPFVILLALCLKNGIAFVKEQAHALNKAFLPAIALTAIASIAISALFLSFAFNSSLFVQYPEFWKAGSATQTYLSSIEAVAYTLPDQSIVFLLNMPEYMNPKGGLGYNILLTNEASVQAWLDWKFPKKGLEAFSLTGLFLHSGLEETELSSHWTGNCVFKTENLNKKNATIYASASWKQELAETDGIVLTPAYREEESISIRFSPDRTENTFLLVFDGKNTKVFSLKEFCR